MKAEIIAVGTEILTGQIINTNAQFLSEKCAELGIDVFFHTAVGDNEQRLLDTLSTARKRSELVILCGGLGPTEDDLTKQTLAKFLEKELVFDQSALEKLDRFFASRKGRIRTPNNERQAQIIEGSIALQNPAGLAVGGFIEVAGVRYIVLPGPPSELKAMFTESLQPLLLHSGQQLYSRVLRFFGIGESQLVTILADLIAHQSDPTVAPYAKTGEVTLRLSTKAQNQEVADKKLDALEKEILERENLGKYLYGYGDENSLAKVVAYQLQEHGLPFTIIESNTAGLLQHQLTLDLAKRELFKGGCVVVEDCSQEEMITIIQETCHRLGAHLGVALFGQIKPESQPDNVMACFSILLLIDDQIIKQEVELGGYTEEHLRQIACLHALFVMRNILLNRKNLL